MLPVTTSTSLGLLALLKSAIARTGMDSRAESISGLTASAAALYAAAAANASPQGAVLYVMPADRDLDQAVQDVRFFLSALEGLSADAVDRAVLPFPSYEVDPYRGMSKEHLNPTLVRTIRKIGGWLRWRFDPEPDVCPTDAITEPQLTWPRIVRRAFSDPIVPHESTGVHGRGTEEVKTNDITRRVGPGDAGFTVEFGRPTVGVRFW